jgi:hypothetical protein
LFFAGYNWKISDGNATMNHSNLWKADPKMQFVDQQGKLHLKLKKFFGVWYCSQIQMTRSLGRGKYEFCVENQFANPDKRIVFSIFINDDQNQDGLIEASKNETEVNMTFTKWNESGNSNFWYMLKPISKECIGKCPPDNSCSGIHCFSATGNPTQAVSHEIQWTDKNKVNLMSYRGCIVKTANPQYVITKKQFTNFNLPHPGSERLTINLWLYGGNNPDAKTGDEVEIVISAFRFTP